MKRFRSKVLMLAVMMLAICVKAWADVEINETNFPDAALRRELKDSNYDTDQDGRLSDTEIASITVLSFSSWFPPHVSSLKGIEYFTALQSIYL